MLMKERNELESYDPMQGIVEDDNNGSASSIVTTDNIEGTTTRYDESFKGDDDTIKQRRISDVGITTSAQTTREIFQVKIIVLLVLLISTAGAIAVFFNTKNSEQAQFEKQYSDDANKVLGSLLNSMERSLGAFNMLSVSFVTMIKQENQTFPFVRVPNYAAQVAQTIQLTGAIATYFAPIVRADQRREWEAYASSKNSNIWKVINETLDFQKDFPDYYGPSPDSYNWTFHDTLYTDFDNVPYNDTQPIYIPEFQDFPLIMKSYGPCNYDWGSLILADELDALLNKKEAMISGPILFEDPNSVVSMFFKDFLPSNEKSTEPYSFWAYPVVDRVDNIDTSTNPKHPDGYDVKALIIANIFWRHLLRDILPPSSKGIVIVFDHKGWGRNFTYQIDGAAANFLGRGDHHDPKYDNMKITRDLFDLDAYRMGTSHYYGVPIYLSANSSYTLSVYPSDDMESSFTTSKPIVFAVSAVAFIMFPFLLFLLYDRMVNRQKQEILSTANQSYAIVSSLFPSNIRDQLLPQDFKGMGTMKGKYNSTETLGPPIADLYPETTVLFCDIVDFTKWSSVRDPSQVFTLLESLYCAFDVVATRRKIFKVETIGDCYVAVAGLPDPRRDHAEVMARYAHEMLRKVTEVTAELGTTLGPGTSTLQVRIGLNSGPTTAGVLRGAKGRFQLFGDTINTAARMESNSLPGRIMCSQKTADVLIAGGKEQWITKREGLVDAKGKGMLQCYWINLKGVGRTESLTQASTSDHVDVETYDLDTQTVIWISEVLESLLKDLVLQRNPSDINRRFSIESFASSLTCPRDEVSEIIVLPEVQEKKASSSFKDLQAAQVTDNVKQQIRTYVSAIAKMYRKNPFHNFNHASHVVMSSRKLLNRVAKPTTNSPSATAYGISSDPLTQFAIVFSALIHDVDHPGVSNAQLVKEQADVAIHYDNKSVAEQNSVSLAWNLLMEPQYSDFRNLIMKTESESRRFRQLIVNSVMATDLFDADLKSLRETRWARVFDSSGKSTSEVDDETDRNRRATIVIEHLIQASDVSHTMQHWHVYQEWNRRLLHEMYKAYIEGRADKDPSVGWYEGELWFFDNYVIPLAKKLETCGVFGVSCGELLDYAQDNRAEWAAKGQAIVADNLTFVKATMSAQESGEGKWTSCLDDALNNAVSI